MRFSIVIPTYRRVDALIDTLKSIQAQSYKNWEVIIVDQSPNEQAQEIRKNVREILGERGVYFHIMEPSSTKARNEGIKYATGDWIIFCDDDVDWGNALFEKICFRILNNSKLCMIAGIDYELPPKRKSSWRRLLSSMVFINDFQQDRAKYIGGVFGSFPTINVESVEAEWAMGFFFVVDCSFIRKFSLQFDEKLSKYAYAEDLDFTHRLYLLAKANDRESRLFKEIGVRHMVSKEWRSPSKWVISSFLWNRFYIGSKLTSNRGRVSFFIKYWIANIAYFFIFLKQGVCLDYLRAMKCMISNLNAIKRGEMKNLYNSLGK